MKRKQNSFEESLHYFKTILGEQDYRKNILDLMTKDANNFHYEFAIDLFMLDNKNKNKNTIIKNELHKMFEFCQSSNYQQITATLMDPEYIGLPSHYVSIIIFTKLNRIIYFDSAKSLERESVYCAEIIERLLKNISRKYNYTFDICCPIEPIQFSEDDTYCQTWSLIFLINSIGKTYTEIMENILYEFRFINREDKILYLISKVKEILNYCELIGLDKCIAFQSTKKKRKYLSIKSDLMNIDYY